MIDLLLLINKVRYLKPVFSNKKVANYSDSKKKLDIYGFVYLKILL